MEQDYKLFDTVTGTLLVNLAIENKRNNGVVLSPFNPNNVDHLYSFEIALILSDTTHEKFYLDMEVFDYWKFRFKNWSVRKSFKRYNDKVSITKMELDKILDFMKESLKLEDDIYKQIYEEYYKVSNENRSIYRRKHKK